MTTPQQVCNNTWKSSRLALVDEPTRYRQHRCGQENQHEGNCVCKYCGTQNYRELVE